MKYIAVLVFLLILPDCVVAGDDSSMRRSSVKDTNLDHLVFNISVLFESTVVSRAECSGKCLLHDGCAAFTFITTEPVTCRGYPTAPLPETESFPFPGAETWYFTYQFEEWRERSCQTDSDCPAVNIKCHKKKCMCLPGFYYSNADNFCVYSCPESDLQPTYMGYGGNAILHGHQAQRHNTTAQQCMDWCSAVVWCRGVEYWSTQGISILSWIIRAEF
nr:hypothetical protein BaRGS_025842 [Batillaria attramentaria]